MPFPSKSKIFLILCISFLLGVLLGPLLPLKIMVIAAVIFVMVSSIGFGNKYALLIGIAGLVLLAGSLRYQSAAAKNNLEKYYGQNVEMDAVVSQEPDVRDDKILLTLSQIVIAGNPMHDQILATVYPYRNFSYGDKLHLIGKITQPKDFDNFSYQNYLASKGVHGLLNYPNSDVITTGQGNWMKAELLNFKQKFLHNLQQLLPEPQNAFLAGLLVGQKRSIPQNYIDDFNATGTSHIIAISGYNITIIAWALDLLLRRFGKRVSLVGSSLAIISFVILTGGSASVIRAAIMGSLGLVALNVGRLFNINTALAGTAAVMVAINPQILPYDVGFQLSFLALAGLVYLSPVIAKYFEFLPQIFAQPLVATLAAQIFALPILLYNFDQLSLIAPITNLLVLELVPLTMLFGFVTGLLGFIWLPFAALFSWPAWICLSYILKVVELTAKISFASLSVHLNLAAVASYYVAVVAILFWQSFKRQDLQLELKKVPYLLYK